MANVQEYNAQFNPTTEVQSTQARGEGVGKGLENLFQGVGQLGTEELQKAEKYKMAEADTKIARINGDFETYISNQEEPTDLTDPDEVEKFLKPREEAKQQLLDSLSDPRARVYAEKKLADHDAMYWNLAVHNNQTLEKKQTLQAFDDRKNIDIASVSRNPSLLPTKIEDLNGLDDYVGGGISQAMVDRARQDLKKEYSVAAAKGKIYDPDSNPSDVIKELKDPNGQFKYTGDKTDQLIEMAERQAVSREKQTVSDDKKAVNADKQLKAQNFQNMLLKIDNGEVSFSDINKASDDGVIDGTHRKTASDRLQRLVDGTQKDDPAVQMKLFADMRRPDGDPEKPTDFGQIADKYGHGLSQKSLTRAAQIFLAPKGSDADISDGMKKLSDVAAKAIIRPNNIPWGDRPGMAKWAGAINEMHNTYLKNIEDKSATAQEMFDPSNKKYLGNVIQKYVPSRAEITEQAKYTAQGPAKYSPDLGIATEQPIGTDPNATPIKTDSKSSGPALTPKEQAALDAISSKILGGGK